MVMVISGDDHMDVAHNERCLVCYRAPVTVSYFAALLELREELRQLIIRYCNGIVKHFSLCQPRVRVIVQ